MYTGTGKLTGKEMSVQGTLSWSVLGAYLKASGGYLAGVVLLFFVFMNVASQSFPAWWISIWLEKDFPVSYLPLLSLFPRFPSRDVAMSFSRTP